MLCNSNGSHFIFAFVLNSWFKLQTIERKLTQPNCYRKCDLLSSIWVMSFSCIVFVCLLFHTWSNQKFKRFPPFRLWLKDYGCLLTECTKFSKSSTDFPQFRLWLKNCNWMVLNYWLWNNFFRRGTNWLMIHSAFYQKRLHIFLHINTVISFCSNSFMKLDFLKIINLQLM